MISYAKLPTKLSFFRKERQKVSFLEVFSLCRQKSVGSSRIKSNNEEVFYMQYVITALIAVICLVLGVVIGYAYRKKVGEAAIGSAEEKANPSAFLFALRSPCTAF